MVLPIGDRNHKRISILSLILTQSLYDNALQNSIHRLMQNNYVEVVMQNGDQITLKVDQWEELL